ncbi:prephenate dehydrogenase/arogenate dehydrogenase family protein [Haloarcula sp. S1AR25-5A]|uniref:Prephenate dehydrogenase/arogenate dehydrogenase family protein n=1 Tax=Haloarcula terrestris TaxID=2950533 RepID=A0AAE4JIJ1_9EURY|nr:prephenate dehydrogenase/arogenate dehydrogenase family protein [Haloarcula terrestris]MDS0221151.1 prephenate dehydrogenase/arogenate dehydrogenase family protein [Haloarcula terrestris]
MNVLVVGAGAMGRWFARTVRAHADASVAFTDVDPAAAEAAADAVGGRAVASDATETFDVVCIAVPMPVAETAIDEFAPLAADAIVDVTGSMAGPIAAMRAAMPEGQRLSLHPLFAPENAPGNVAVVADAPGPETETVVGALTDAGNDCFETTAAEHDGAMETVQASAHAAVLAFAMAAADVPDRFQTPISAGLFDLVEQVTGGDPRVYADIQDAFDGADAVAEAARQIADADADTFEGLYEQLS